MTKSAPNYKFALGLANSFKIGDKVRDIDGPRGTVIDFKEGFPEILWDNGEINVSSSYIHLLTVLPNPHEILKKIL